MYYDTLIYYLSLSTYYLFIISLVIIYQFYLLSIFQSSQSIMYLFPSIYQMLLTYTHTYISPMYPIYLYPHILPLFYINKGSYITVTCFLSFMHSGFYLNT